MMLCNKVMPFREDRGNCSFLLPANVVCEGYVFTPVCDSVNRGACMVALGGACVVAPGGCVWLLRGGVHGEGGHVWQRGCAW